MDERDMEEEGKNRKGKGWEIGINMFFFLVFIFFWNCYFMFKEKCNQESESPWGKIKCIKGVSEIRVLILTRERTRQFMKLFSITFCKIRKSIPRFFAPQFLPNESFCVIN
jgi:Na+/melibiose symporter-like transporter